MSHNSKSPNFLTPNGVTSGSSSRPSTPPPDYPDADEVRRVQPIADKSPKPHRRSPTELELPPQLKLTPAQELHLKNHFKYATIKGSVNFFASCPICQQFLSDLEKQFDRNKKASAPTMPEKGPFPGIWSRSPQLSPKNLRRSADSQRAEEYYDYTRKNRGDEQESVYVKVKRGRIGQPRRQQLSVQTGEFLRVIDDKTGDWWICENRNGHGGYVPKTFLDTEFYKEPEISRRRSDLPYIYVGVSK